MNILLVDNGTTYLGALKLLLHDHNVNISSYKDIPVDNSQYDLIILSGGHNFSVIGNQEKLEREINTIITSNTPILGICFGFELIGYAFGAHLSHQLNKDKGIVAIKKVSPDPIFINTNTIYVYESHRWVINDLGDQLIPLAKSPKGVEIFRHRSRMIYGFQFHPEMFPDRTNGDELFSNFIRIVDNIKL